MTDSFGLASSVVRFFVLTSDTQGFVSIIEARKCTLASVPVLRVRSEFFARIFTIMTLVASCLAEQHRVLCVRFRLFLCLVVLSVLCLGVCWELTN